MQCQCLQGSSGSSGSAPLLAGKGTASRVRDTSKGPRELETKPEAGQKPALPRLHSIVCVSVSVAFLATVLFFAGSDFSLAHDTSQPPYPGHRCHQKVSSAMLRNKSMGKPLLLSSGSRPSVCRGVRVCVSMLEEIRVLKGPTKPLAASKSRFLNKWKGDNPSAMTSRIKR